MNIDGDVNTNEYIVTAIQIFDYCGVDRTGTINVDTLIEKFAPFVKTNKTEYSHLKSLLDPDQMNPEITVSKLASTLNRYSENQKIKIDLDESFNLKGGQLPQDSDSGISNDGFQILEELQCELREKSHLAHQLRTQLELTDRHHEEALGALIAERDTLRAQLNVMREENASLSHARQDYEEACERLGSSERALSEARHELAAARRRVLRLADQLTMVEAEKLTLQELLTQSKDECHRINEMYASRQSLLLEENESLKTDHADISTRLQDQEEFMQQMIKEKVLLEMELKDVLNKSNHIHSRIDRSIDVSYTEDQILTTLDSLNAESKFIQESQILDEETFLNTLDEDSGRPSNMSLFDEIRLSFYNKSKLNLSELNCTEFFEKRCEHLDSSFGTVATQTDDNLKNLNTKYNGCKQTNTMSKILKDEINNISIGIQTDNELSNKNKHKEFTCFTQTELIVPNFKVETTDISMNASTQVFEVCKDVEVMNLGVQTDMATQAYSNANNISMGIQTDNELSVKNKHKEFTCFTQTEFNASNFIVETTDTSTNTSTQVFEIFKDVEVINVDVQTDKATEAYSNADSIQNCTECDKLKEYATNLENNLRNSHFDFKKQLNGYEKNLSILKIHIEEGNARNDILKSVADNLKSKINILESAYVEQNKRINEFDSKSISESICDQSSVATQAEMPCADCVKHNAPSRCIRRFFWESVKCLFQLFAAVCFVCAVCVLYGVRRAPAACRELPARWLRPADLLDLLLRVEYVADVPM